MNYTILGYENRMACKVEVIKAETIKVSRRASQTFDFTEAARFVEAIKGKSSVVVYVGKVKDETGTEVWKAMYWEPSDPHESSGYSGRGMGGEHGTNVLPLGSLAWLQMDCEFDIEWELERLAKACQEYMGVRHQLERWAKQLREVNRDNRFSDAERYAYMNAEEMKKIVVAMKEEYAKLTNARVVDLKEPEPGESSEEEDFEENE